MIQQLFLCFGILVSVLQLLLQCPLLRQVGVSLLVSFILLASVFLSLLDLMVYLSFIVEFLEIILVNLRTILRVAYFIWSVNSFHFFQTIIHLLCRSIFTTVNSLLRIVLLFYFLYFLLQIIEFYILQLFLHLPLVLKVVILFVFYILLHISILFLHFTILFVLIHSLVHLFLYL